MRLVRPRSATMDPGLSLALGGEGITLRDLVLLYAALGDDGVAKPLAYTEAEAPAAADSSRAARLVRADNARQILDILRETPTAGRTGAGGPDPGGPRWRSRPAPPTASATRWRPAWSAATPSPPGADAPTAGRAAA